jgi:hypothetical protein
MYTTETGKFAGLELVPMTIALDGGSPVYLLRHIDLGFPRELCDYDKGGGRILIRQVKECLFGSPTFRMTEARSSAFFGRDANFCLRDDCPACIGTAKPQTEPRTVRHSVGDDRSSRLH